MWREMARIIHEVRPRFAFVENSPMLTSRGLGVVLGDLASMGFDAKWGVLGAADVGANHQRDRIWIVAKWRGQLPYAQHNRIRRWEQQQESTKKENGTMANTMFARKRWDEWESKIKKNVDSISNAYLSQQQRRGVPSGVFSQNSNIGNPCWWEIEPNVGRVADGVAARVDRLKAIGNGQVPLCAAEAWRILSA